MLECIGCRNLSELESLEPPDECRSPNCTFRLFFKKVNKQLLELYFRFWFLEIEPFTEVAHIGENEFQPSLILYSGEKELKLIQKIDEMNDGSISILDFDWHNPTRVYGRLVETGNPTDQLAAQHEFNLFLSKVLDALEADME